MSTGNLFPIGPTQTGEPLGDPNKTPGILGNRNFLNLLGGIAAKLDPQGAGAALGGATIAYNQAQASSERADADAASRNTQQELMTKILANHGGFTPAGTPGVTKLEAKDGGGVVAHIDPELAGGGYTAQGAAPASAVAPAAAPTTPVAPVAPTVAPNAGATAVTEPTNATGVNTRISDIIPFY